METPRRPSFNPRRSRAPAEKPEYNRRFVARVIDGFVAAVPTLLLVAVLAPGVAGRLLAAAAGAAYVLFSDGLTGVPFMRRRSLGKRLMGLRPERLDGAPMDLRTSARRNGTLVLGYLGALPAAGWLLSGVGLALVALETGKVYANPQGRRWGDEWAGTRVLEVRSARRRSR